MTDRRTRTEKVAAMAEQTASPNERAAARRKLGLSPELTIKPLFWVLGSDHTPIPTDDSREFSALFNSFEGRNVMQTRLDGVRVSTVFLGVNHRFGSEGPPLLFETMVFGAREYFERHATWAEAEAAHLRIVRGIKEGTLYV